MTTKPVTRFVIAAMLGLTMSVPASAITQGTSGRPVSRTIPQHDLTARSRYSVPTADGARVSHEVRNAFQSASILDDVHRNPIGLRARTLPRALTVDLCSGTYWDLQHNDDGQKQIGTLGRPDGYNVHFVWTRSLNPPDPVDDPVNRNVNYQAYNTTLGVVILAEGWTISQHIFGRAGFPTVAVGRLDRAHAAFHERNLESQTDPPGPYSLFVADQDATLGVDFSHSELSGSRDAEAVWPHIAVNLESSSTKAPGDDVYHVAAHPTGAYGNYTDEIFYWRRVAADGAWEGPIVLDEDPASLSHHVATDPTSEKVAVIYECDELEPVDLLQIVFIESEYNGQDWITDGVGIFPEPLVTLPTYSRNAVTNYFDPEGPQAWLDCTGEYDLDGHLHIVWVEQAYANQTAQCRLKHWDALNGDRTIAQALHFVNVGRQGARDLWLAYPQVAFGDGSTVCTQGPGDQTNYNYVYVTYEQYGGPTAEGGDDASTRDYQNLEFYLTVSNDGGNTWSSAVNLTNTRSPGCDGTPGNECASERDPSIALVVNDTIHIFYILDKDAGDAVFGQGTWTLNPVRYLRIPGGTDTPPICPSINPNFAAHLTNQDPDCEYHARYDPPGFVSEELVIENAGNAALYGNLSTGGSDWLWLPAGAFAVGVGGPADRRTVIMDASAASIASSGEGLYQDEILITHNDITKPSPHVMPVDFFVFDDFYCAEYAKLRTSGESGLWLEVGNTERFGNLSDEEGGLARLSGDMSWSVHDGSLLIARDADSGVFRNIYGEGNFQPGFRALSHLEFDTSAYGSGVGEVTAFARQTTTDSLIGIDVEYVFPQDPDSSGFVLIRYRISNRTDGWVNDLAVGVAVDFDVMPGTDVVDVQVDARNTGHLQPDVNLLYQQGVDSLGHVPQGDNTATRFTAGITSIQPIAAPRAWIAQNDPYLDRSPGRGFHESYLYPEMQKFGWEILEPYDAVQGANLHSVMVFKKNIDLAPTTVKHYITGLVSSNQADKDADDLVASAQKAWKYSFGWHEIVTCDTVPESTQVSYPYFTVGTHEDGLASGCCGCEVSKVSGDVELSIVPGADQCEGTIVFTGGDPCLSPYSATFRVESPDCGGAKYTEDVEVTMAIAEECPCDCPSQGDFDGDGFLTALDLSKLVDILFAGKPNVYDPDCPTARGDLDCDLFTTALDLAVLIDRLFAGGPPPCDPCVTPPAE